MRPPGRALVRRGARGLLVDLGLCAVVLATTLPATWDAGVSPHRSLLATLLLPAVVAPLPLRRSRPLAAAALFTLGCVVSAAPSLDQFRLGAAIPAALLLAYGLGARTSGRRSAAGLVCLAAGLLVVGATDAVLSGPGGVVAVVLATFPVTGVVWGAGRSVRTRERLALALARQTAELQQRREVTAVLAVEVERSRLATDLDVAARGRVEEMVGLARTEVTDPATAAATFARLEVLGREALDEMRGLLGVLRSDDRGARTPRPTLAQLDDLLSAARTSGRPVTLTVEGEARPLPAGVELVAYRAVQHALAALDKEQDTTVALRYTRERLELTVDGTADHSPEARAATASAAERVGSFGGTFLFERPAGGRLSLAAHLPIPAVTGV